MPGNKYLNISIDEQALDIGSPEDVSLSINYQLEDQGDFQTKKSVDAFNVNVPATVNNDKIANTFHNPDVEDNTPGQQYRNFRKAIIESNSNELLVGKALLTSAKHNNRPQDYEYQFFGNNGDWLLDVKETTLFDILKHINFTFTKQRIIDSWGFDGTDEGLPYVFAPVRYGYPMDELKRVDQEALKDINMMPVYMRPALSKYWIIYWAFKSLGYKIKSDFLDSEYFRRQVMPWTWGNFLFSEGTRLDNLRFLAKSTEEVHILNESVTQLLDVKASNDSTNGAFDNNGVYEYVNPSMKWTYLNSLDYGSLEATFYFNMAVRMVVTANSDAELRIQWFHNGVRISNGNDNGNGTLLKSLNGPTIGRDTYDGPLEDYFTIVVDPGDVIEAKIFIHTFHSSLGIVRVHANVDAFELSYLKVALNGRIDFENFDAFKKHKFIDYLRGIIDEFNLAIQTDPISKVITIEPLHPYSLTDDLSVKQGGYMNGNFIDWSEKQDLSKISESILFSDSEKELLFRYKEDGNDGILKVVQDRYVTILAASKYVLPDRFKTGKKEIENRFFSPLMHYDVNQWEYITGTAPQMPCLIPENISNTSRSEAQNTFEPKSAYYKGILSDVGWIFDSEEMNEFPFMFAVNYKPGGEDDPILSYSDQRIGDSVSGSASGVTAAIGKGLLKRFYWQRLAIMRNGQYYNTFFKLNNNDLMNYLHREHIICRGQKWELVLIKDYKPLDEETTQCSMRKWSPVTRDDFNNSYPSESNVLDSGATARGNDIKYAQLKCIPTDIPAV